MKSLLIIIGLSFLAALLFDLSLRRTVTRNPQFAVRSTPGEIPPVAVIIPAYNEAENIETCVTSVLQSTPLSKETLQVWVIDDQSSDATWTIVQSLQDPRLKLLPGKPKPTGETWVGKSWACTQAAEQATGDYLLFIDADVRLQAGAIETVVQQAQTDAADLLSCGPALECGCFSEWLVQPLILSIIMVAYDFESVNDPKSENAFAAGPFMLFRRSAYEQIGGHRAVAAQVVEDLALAQLIKRSGLKLKMLGGSNLASLRMYRSGAALWEGWTKNMYLGVQRNFFALMQLVLVMLLIYVIPWVGLAALLIKVNFSGFSSWDGVAIAFCCLAIALHYDMRRTAETISKVPTRYWWLAGLGGLAVIVLAVASLIKTETGWGWTWRGRPLKAALKD
ncbi:glycosyltransferase [Phormidium tenue FACHB-886]|nr:glycosyltransferase [Phormidium tenue FACHB-886]